MGSFSTVTFMFVLVGLIMFLVWWSFIDGIIWSRLKRLMQTMGTILFFGILFLGCFIICGLRMHYLRSVLEILMIF